MNKYKNISKEDLIREYVETDLSISQVRKKFDLSHSTFVKALKFFELEVKGRQSKYPELRDKEWLKKQYIEDLKSVRQIASEIGATVGATHSAIRWLGIDLRKSRVGLDIRFPEGRFGKNAARWKGGRRVSKAGYVRIYSVGHPLCSSDGYVMEHRLVMEEHLGRYLTKEEVVHHKNGNKQDNRIENLELLSTKQEHVSLHFAAIAENDALRAEIARLQALLDKK